MTRSIVRLMQGDPLASLRLHPAGPLMAGILAGLSMRQGVEALLAREWGGNVADRIASAALLAALFVTLAIRLAGLFGA
jgi:nitrate/nitrite transporter NarK